MCSQRAANEVTNRGQARNESLQAEWQAQPAQPVSAPACWILCCPATEAPGLDPIPLRIVPDN